MACTTCGSQSCSCNSICVKCGIDPCGCLCERCGCYPCGCGIPINMQNDVNINPNGCTVCGGDTSNNIWYQPGPPGHPGKCKLDLMTYEQVYKVLQRVPIAKRDLLRITTDQILIRLANTTAIIVPIQEDDRIAQKRLLANSLPYYTVLRGNVDGTPGNS